MTKYTPVIRVILTFLAAGLAVVVATVHSETVRIVASAITVGLAAVGIVPPHVGTVTSVVEKDEPVNIVKQDGRADGGFLMGLLILAVLIVILVPAAHLSALWLLLLVLVVVLVVV